MTATEGQSALEALDKFLINYIRLAYDANQDGLVFFNITPKLHYLDHVRWDLRGQLSRQQQRVLNPMAFYCHGRGLRWQGFCYFKDAAPNGHAVAHGAEMVDRNQTSVAGRAINS